MCMWSQHIDPPSVIAAPVIQPSTNGMATVDYMLDSHGKECDQLLVSWFICDDNKLNRSGEGRRQAAATSATENASVDTGLSANFLKVTVQPSTTSANRSGSAGGNAKPVTDADVLVQHGFAKFQKFCSGHK